MHVNEDHGFIDISHYQRLIGKLIYLTLTRPDISYVVQVVSQFMHASTTRHLETAYRIVCYLKNSPDQGLLYHSRHDLRVEAFIDADWDDLYRRSTSSYYTSVRGNLVSWYNKKQSVVAQSSVEAEFQVMTHWICEMLYIRGFLRARIPLT